MKRRKFNENSEFIGKNPIKAFFWLDELRFACLQSARLQM